jgi:hypothetical protein
VASYVPKYGRYIREGILYNVKYVRQGMGKSTKFQRLQYIVVKQYWQSKEGESGSDI